MKKLFILSLIALSASQSIVATYDSAGYGGSICKTLNDAEQALNQLSSFFDDSDPRSQQVEQVIQIVDKIAEDTIKTSHNKDVAAKNKGKREKVKKREQERKLKQEENEKFIKGKKEFYKKHGLKD